MAKEQGENPPPAANNSTQTSEGIIDAAFPDPVISTRPANREASFHSLLYRILAGVVTADRQKLTDLSSLSFRARVIQARTAEPPPHPLDDERVAYGYLSALSDAAQLGQRFIVDHAKVGFVIGSRPASRIIRGLADLPVGVMAKSEIASELGIGKRRLPKILRELETRGLVREEIWGNPKIKPPFRVIALTASGNAVSEILGRMDQKDKRVTASSPTDLVTPLLNEDLILPPSSLVEALDSQVHREPEVHIIQKKAKVVKLGRPRPVLPIQIDKL